MRAPARVLLALAALLALALAALALALPRLAASDAVRARIGEAVRDATRRELVFASLEAGLFPPRLEVLEASLSGGAEGPAAEARRVELRLALLPLLARTVVVRSLRVEGAALRAERSEQGLRLVGEDLPEPPKPERPEKTEAAPSDARGFAFAVQRVVLADASLRLDDLTRERAPRIELRALEGELAGIASDASLRAELEGSLASGGRLALRGEGRRSGPFEATVELGDVELDAFEAYAEGAKLRARASGTVRVSGATAQPGAALLDLRLEAEALELGDLTLRGPLALRADLAGGDLRAAAGPLSLDASDGELGYRRIFHKPAGVPATLKGMLQRTRAGNERTARLEGAELLLGGIRAQGLVELEPRLVIRLDAPPFEAAPLAALVPVLEGRSLAGRLALAGLAVEAEPLAVRGRLELDALGFGGLAAEPLVLRGALEGTGAEIVGRDLRASLAGEDAPLTLVLDGLGGAPRLRLATRLEDADSSALLAAFGGDRDRLSGPLDLEADLSAPLGGKEPPLAALLGDISLRIAPGRLRKLSLLRAAFEAAGAGKAAGGKDDALERHYGDEFESLSGRFRIRGGEAHTDDLRLVYEGYSAELRGSVGLADRALDLRGTLTLEEELGGALASGGAGPRSIPLASVTGTLDEPRVSLTREALAGIAAAYAGDTHRREKWERKLDERLGEGRGKDVLEALDQMLDKLKQPADEGAGSPR
jgi:hypothetical protein